MSANIITLLRILLSIVVLLMFRIDFYWGAAALVLTAIVFYMDALDGYIARKLGVASDFGALFDITGDRIVEHVYWIFFTAVGMVSMWVPIIFISRSFLVDTVRSVAFSKEGKTPFGEKSMMRSEFTTFLTASRFMRGSYGFVKVLVFLMLGAIITLESGISSGIISLSEDFMRKFIVSTEIIVWLTVFMNIIRGLPVLWDGRYYLFAKEFPKDIKDAG
ncbi:CDP-alcohol phosphatidyltransferase family protein [candidate division KSB1 bacterium]